MKDIYFETNDYNVGFRMKVTLVISHYLTKLLPSVSEKLALKILANPFSRRKYDLRTKVKPSSVKLKTLIGEVVLYKFSGENSDSNKNILLCHGWADSTTRFTQLIDHLINEGVTVWSLDHIGHGKSFGSTAHLFGVVDGTKAALRHLTDNNASPQALLGHSLGALAVLNLPHEVLKNKKIILVSAPTKFFENMYKSITRAGVSALMLTNLLEKTSAKYGVDWESLSPANNKDKINENFLFIHDDKDLISSYTNIKELIKDHKHEFLTTTGLGHVRLLKDPGVLKRISSSFTTGL